MTLELQILHASDLESGIPALQDARNFSTVLNALRDDFANTLILSSGDNYIPGPFFSAASDRALRDTDTSDGFTFREGVGRVDIELMNQMGFQASALGNHEFDLGESTVVSLVDNDREYRGAQFPYLSSNLTFNDGGSGDLQDLVVPDGQAPQPNTVASSVVFTIDGEQVGVVGATTPTLARIASPGPNITISPAPFGSNPSAAELDALAAEIQQSVDALVNSGINKVILLAHMQQLDIERELARRLRNVDVIIAGGSHTLLTDSTDRVRPGDTSGGVYPLVENSPTGPVLVVNSAANWRYVNRLVVNFDDNGVIDLNALNPAVNGAYATDPASVAALTATNPGTPDPEVVNLLDQLGTIINTKDGNIFGSTSVFLNGTRNSVRTEETNLGNLTADANLFVAQQADSSTVISLKNGGGIRDNIGTITAAGGSTNPDDFEFLPPPANPSANKAEGNVSQLDVENSLRFNNGLTLVTVTAAQLKEIMEHAVSGVRPGATPGSFPQVGGISFSFDASGTAQVLNSDGTVQTPGTRIRSVALIDANGNFTQPIVQNGAIVGDPNRTFRMVTLNFLADGGDGYPFSRIINENTARANRLDLVNATAPRTGTATFAADGSEQDAFAEYLATFPSPFSADDTSAVEDRRIQNLGVRSDGVFNILLQGSNGRNVLTGNFGDDVINGRRGNDRISGAEGDDSLIGAQGNDKLIGGAGNDTLIGGTGGDRLVGQGGNDQLFGNQGNDQLIGNAGNDLLVGGTGLDRMTGGAGRDTFVLERGGGFALITDFRRADTLGLQRGLRFENLRIRQAGRDTIIRQGGDVLARLQNFQAPLTAADFITNAPTTPIV